MGLRLVGLVLLLLGGAMLLAIATGSDWMPFGLSSDDLARLFYLIIVGLVVTAAAFGSGLGLGRAARSMLIWLGVVVALVAGYQYRYEVQDMASRVTSGLVPGSPLSVTTEGGRTSVALERLSDGHFAVQAEVNGTPTWMLFDTGATNTVLTTGDAEAAGIDVSGLRYDVPITTANGTAKAAAVTARELRVGDISRRSIRVLVSQPGMLGQSLLGMNFISSLTGFDMRGDRLTLID